MPIDPLRPIAKIPVSGRAPHSFCFLLPWVFWGLWCSGSPVVAAERWIRVNSPHFELYTTSGAEVALRTLNSLEQLRSVPLPSGASEPVSEKPLRIIAFRSPEQYQPYRPHPSAWADFRHGRRGDYIAVADLRPERTDAIRHEYWHYRLAQRGGTLPLWLNEGGAELFSSLEPLDQGTRIGRVLPGRPEGVKEIV